MTIDDDLRAEIEQTNATIVPSQSREDLIDAGRREKLPVDLGAKHPLQPRKREYTPGVIGKEQPGERFGVQATIVAFMLQSLPRGATMREILDAVSPFFPQHARHKLARTIYDTARLGKLPGGRRMHVDVRGSGESALLVVDRASVPTSIGKRPSAL